MGFLGNFFGGFIGKIVELIALWFGAKKGGQIQQQQADIDAVQKEQTDAHDAVISTDTDPAYDRDLQRKYTAGS